MLAIIVKEIHGRITGQVELEEEAEDDLIEKAIASDRDRYPGRAQLQGQQSGRTDASLIVTVGIRAANMLLLR